MNKVLSDKKTILLLCLPGILIYTFAILSPIILSIYLGMTDWSGIDKPTFVGLKNFNTILFSDVTFWKSLMHAVLLALAYLFIQHPIALMFAIFIDKIGGKAEKIFRTIFFVPAIIPVIVTSRMWVSLYDPQYGLINKALDFLHLGFLKHQWLGDPRTVLPSVIVILMWQGFGWALLIYYAGLKGIPEELYEAARIDGATGFKLYTKITVPLLKPVIKVNFTIAIISALKQMETIYLTTNGGPGDASQFLANYLYIKAFSSYQYGYANAISVLFVIVCLAINLIFQKIFKPETYEY
ncbi:carbohydrate ABC transporter permease [Thermoanaerobacter pentosaceus]|uniref:Raffinose/stachyose/melibiose transport system permease protein n=1 Tax=Thermoanaerobacter pentosaceus TaxID=694059 RepID=A0ABT9M224_9THEO|nr:sugar ABC transporter permease [Thermoanaerobacter pentosaceus]MDP9750152.1 raffinose/stachyose/melibiose transport system permease protein [Thermoanaerobacter pentosaceus]